MSDAYSIVDIPKSLPIHCGMALTSTGRKIEHNKVVVDTQTQVTYKSNCWISLCQTETKGRWRALQGCWLFITLLNRKHQYTIKRMVWQLHVLFIQCLIPQSPHAGAGVQTSLSGCSIGMQIPKTHVRSVYHPVVNLWNENWVMVNLPHDCILQYTACCLLVFEFFHNDLPPKVASKVG